MIYAEIVLDVYQNNLYFLHNKFFKKMTPLFSKTCNYTIYKIPRRNHFEYSAITSNQETDFFLNSGLISANQKYYEEEPDVIAFVPKVIQQKNHGTPIQTEISPRYKQHLLREVTIHHPEITDEYSFKIGQSLYFLDILPDFIAKKILVKTVIEDSSAKGKAIREFIVEFENINQYVLRKTEDKTEINQFREDVIGI